MTTINSQDWASAPWPPELVNALIAKGLEGSVFFSSLTPMGIGANSVQWPLTDPTGFDWTAAGGLIPSVDPQDDIYAASVAKIAGIIGINNESLDDETIDLFMLVGQAIQNGMAHKVDVDLLYGVQTSNAATPVGIVPSLTAVDGDSLRQGVVLAMADIFAAGGSPKLVLVNPTHWANEVSREASAGPITGAALFSDLGISQVRVCPALAATDTLVIDTNYAFALTRAGSSIETNSKDTASWERDLTSMRVKARVGCALPVKAKAARKVTVTPPTP